MVATRIILLVYRYDVLAYVGSNNTPVLTHADFAILIVDSVIRTTEQVVYIRLRDCN